MEKAYRPPVFFPVALILAGVMTCVAAVGSGATLHVILLLCAASLAFSAGGFLFGARAPMRLAAALSSHLSGARAVQTRLRADAIARKREWSGLIAELAEAQADVQALTERNAHQAEQLAHRQPAPQGKAGSSGSSRRVAPPQERGKNG